MAEIITWNGITKLDIPADHVLREAKKHGLDEVVIIGFDKEGEIYFASSKSDGGSVLWLLEKTKKILLDYEG